MHSRFVISVNHKALKWALTSSNALKRLVRWRIRLLKLNFEVVHAVCIKNGAPDTLLKLMTDETVKTELHEEKIILMIDDIKK